MEDSPFQKESKRDPPDKHGPCEYIENTDRKTKSGMIPKKKQNIFV